MFVTAHLPICDMRHFEPGRGLLGRPTWPLPGDREFIRSFGAVRERRRSAPFPSVWGDEQYFAEADCVLKFDPDRVRDHFAALGPALDCHAQILYRRVFCGPPPIRRVEIGKRLRVRCGANSGQAEFRALMQSVLEMPVRIRGFRAEECRTDLLAGLRLIAERYCASTVPVGAQVNGDARLVTAGEPLFIFECSPDESVPEPGPEFKPVPFSRVREDKLQCRDFRIGGARRRHLRAQVWTFSPDYIKSKQERWVRSSLARLHAERQALRTTVNAISAGAIAMDPAEPETAALREYLRRALAFLERTSISRVPQAELGALITLHESGMPQAQIVLLKQKLEAVSASVAGSIERYLLKHAKMVVGAVDQVNIVGGSKPPEVVTFVNRSSNVQNKIIRIGDNNTINAPITVADHIENSFNAVRDLPEADQRRQLVEELGKQVATLGEKMPSEAEAKKAGRKLEALSNEVAAEEPDKSILEVTGKGLIDAAKTVAEMAAPIAKTVKTLLGLFAIVL